MRDIIRVTVEMLGPLMSAERTSDPQTAAIMMQLAEFWAEERRFWMQKGF